MSGIKNMYVDSLSYVKVKGGESEWVRIDSVVKQMCITSLWFLNVYTDAVMELKIRRGVRLLEEGRE